MLRKLKSLGRYLFTLVGIFFAHSAFGSQVLLVVDAENSCKLPKQFRTTSNSIPNTMSNLGLNSLHLMGSGQFSKESLDYVLAHHPKPYIIFDLRQESHLFVAGTPISWYGRNNWANLTKTDRQVSRLETKLMDNLRKQKTITVNKILKKTHGKILSIQEEKLPSIDVMKEEQLVSEHGIKYVRVFLSDHHNPSDQHVDAFISVYRKIPSSAWIYFHCRGGMGRTTTLMTMVDMMHNAKRLDFETIISRQDALGGMNLLHLPDPQDPKYRYAKERRNFLKHFYEYCKENQDYFATSWTTYLLSSSKATPVTYHEIESQLPDSSGD